MEEWRDVEGYKGHYLVSDLCRVKSIKFNKERIMKASVNSEGYLHVELFLKGIGTCIAIHRLVAIAFIPNPENKATVNHKNCIKTDNRIENLEWFTYSENNTHSWENGLQKFTDNKRKAMIKVDVGRLNKKIVLNTVTGVYYDSIVEAQASMHKKYCNVYLHSKLNGRNKNSTDFILA